MFQLYVVCAEKIMGLAMSSNQDIASISIQVFKGLAKVVQKYQTMVIALEAQHKLLQEELKRNQIETQQVLEAAENLEQSNEANLQAIQSLEKQN